MVAAVARGAVAVLPAVVGGEQVVEGGEEVVVAAGTGLQDGEARGRVGDEEVEEAVGSLRGAGEEVLAVAGEVGDGLRGAGGEAEDRGAEGHGVILPFTGRDRASTLRDTVDPVRDGSLRSRHVAYSPAHHARSHRPAAGGLRRVLSRPLTPSPSLSAAPRAFPTR
ncbi:hypothetical protein GCM10019017_68660 [Streptomyces showdoensis]